MDDGGELAASTLGLQIESTKQRCRALIDRIQSLRKNPSLSFKETLLRLAQSELSFVDRFSNSTPSTNPLSTNIGYLEAILHILQQPFVKAVSRVCKPISLTPSVKGGEKTDPIHVDIVCTVYGNPVWFIVSARNPKYISWDGSCGYKGLRVRVEQVLDAASRSSPASKPSSVILFFANGVNGCIKGMLEDEFGASEFGLEFPDFEIDTLEELEGEWMYVLERSYRQACALEIKVHQSRNAIPKIEAGVPENSLVGSVSTREHLQEDCIALNTGGSLRSLMSGMKFLPLEVMVEGISPNMDMLGVADWVNFDTTSLIALVSGISNGGIEKLMAKPESELRQRFKCNYEFVVSQVNSEIQNPIHVELDAVLSGKTGLICESVLLEFKELVSMCGGPSEKARADYLLSCLLVVPDSPSIRMISLPTTRKLALKNKVVFGTGDYWRAPTLTANMGFVRAVAQTGISLFTLEHRPRALIGD